MIQRSSSLRARTARIARLAALPAPIALGGCGMQVLAPAGDVAQQQAHILIVSTVLMLFIIVPVMALTVLFAWRYRASNKAVEHRPDWDHSTGLELVIWAAPLLIIIALGAITWISTHTLDPYRPIGRISGTQLKAPNAKPLEVQVVALDWKWLFIYPEQGIATVNQLALPLNREVRFRITAGSVMNSFYIPALAGQIYAMPGMETKLHAVLNKPGRFEGFSANYSGAGFSGMRFTVDGLDDAGFAAWVAKMRGGQGRFDRAAYLALAKPSENVAPISFASIDPAVFQRAVEMCVTPGTPCMGETMMRDKRHMGHTPPSEADAKAGQAQGGKEGALLRKPEELGTSARPPAASTPVDPATHPDHR